MVFFQAHAQSYPFYTTQDHHPQSGTASSGLDHPPLISNQENAPQTCSKANLGAAIPQLWSLFPGVSESS